MAALSLFDQLDWSEDRIPVGSTVFVQDALASSSNFLVSSLMRLVLRGSGCILLVSFENSIAHYFSAAKKLGINLTQAEKSNKFTFYDGLTAMLPSGLVSPPQAAPELPQGVPVACGGVFDDRSISQLLCVVRDRARAVQSEHAPCCIVVDGLSALLSFVESPAALLKFVQGCRAIAAQVLLVPYPAKESRSHCCF
jgi:hypothetical protein